MGIPAGSRSQETTFNHDVSADQRAEKSVLNTNVHPCPNLALHYDSQKDRFLKITPNLFTSERLFLFESLNLYTSLIKSHKQLEQGERLRNLSWRILNKALLKENDINRSKKRDGVKNIYYIINPANKPNNQKFTSQASQIPDSSCKYQNKSKNSTQLSKAETHKVKFATPNSATNLTTTASDKAKEAPHKSALKRGHSSAILLNQINFDSKYLFSRKDHLDPVNHHLPKKEDPQTIITGFDTNMVITRNSSTNKNMNSLGKGLAQFSLHDTEKSMSPVRLVDTAPHQGSLFHTTTKGSNTEENTKLKAESQSPIQKSKDKIFFSSEDDDDDSDWDSMSVDSEYGEEDDVLNEEEEDQYYRRQWDKLLFSKNQSGQKKNISRSGTVSPLEGSVADNDSITVRKSLLSGLFHNERDNHDNGAKSANQIDTESHTVERQTAKEDFPTRGRRPERVINVSPVHDSYSQSSRQDKKPKKPTLGTCTVTAVGSVTPPHKSLNEILPIGIRDTSGSTRGSFSSIVSQTTGERYLQESKAPLTAQTILPTALATHMFVPNNIHQQRLAVAAAVAGRAPRMTRRESIDIPFNTSRKAFSIKTRMEISEEERQARTYKRRT